MYILCLRMYLFVYTSVHMLHDLHVLTIPAITTVLLYRSTHHLSCGPDISSHFTTATEKQRWCVADMGYFWIIARVKEVFEGSNTVLSCALDAWKCLWYNNKLATNQQYYFWWKKSCTSWYVVNLIIYKVYVSQVVQDFFHQQYVAKRNEIAHAFSVVD